MKIILIRHGESVDDVLDCYGGAADYPLSDSGKQTAEDVFLIGWGTLNLLLTTA